MSDDNASNEEDESTPPPPSRLGHSANRSLLGIVGNYLLEMRQHVVFMRGLYDDLREMKTPAGPEYEVSLLKEFERHHDADTRNLEDLREQVAGRHVG